MRRLRNKQDLAIREVAAKVSMDTALLSKIETGKRLPTQEQTAALAAFFQLPPESLEALRLAEKFWADNRANPAAAQAAALIEEAAAAYDVNKPVKRMGSSSSSHRSSSGPDSKLT